MENSNNMDAVTNPFQACNDIFFKPNRVFAALAVKHNWSWLAFAFVIALAILPNYFYFNFVDFDWYREYIINASYADVSPAQQDAVRQALNPQQTIMFTVVGVFGGFILINAILATYLNVSTKIDEENVNGFTDWYGFTWWVSMPILLGSLLSVLIILVAPDHQLSPADLSPTSLSYWLGLELGSDWFALAQNVRLEAFWTMYLIAVGISQWTRIEARRAYIIAAVPYILVWGIWGLIVAL